MHFFYYNIGESRDRRGLLHAAIEVYDKIFILTRVKGSAQVVLGENLVTGVVQLNEGINF